MKKLNRNAWVFPLFLTLAFLFFFEVWFQGMAIQGIDDNYSMRFLLKRGMSSLPEANWNPFNWHSFFFPV